MESSEEPVVRPAVDARLPLPDPQTSKRLQLRRLTAVAVVPGVLLGGLNSLSNVFGSPYSPRSLSHDGVLALEVLAAVLGTTWAWALTAFGAGWCTRQVWAGPVAGVISLMIADVTYYLSDSLTGYAQFFIQDLVFWGVMAVPVGLVMGLLGALAGQRRRWSAATLLPPHRMPSRQPPCSS